MKTFKNEWTPQVWEGVGPVLPTAVQDALTYYQQLLIMVNAINETRDNADKLADYTNTELNNIVDYLNERIRDFNTQMNEFFDRTDKAMNKFMQDETANREAFEAEMEAAFNQFTTDITNQWNEFKHTVEQWMDQMNSEWDAVKEAWEAVKAAWEQMKRDWEAFRTQMVSDFEQFKEEIRRLFNEYKNQTNEDLNAWKIATFNYFQGQYDSIKAALEAKLPDIVSNKLPAVLADYAGICLYYDPETRKINVGYDEGLARNGENKLIVTGGGAGGGVTVKAGVGINVEVNEADHQATVSGKIAQASEIGMVKVGTGLEISEDGTLSATSTGGDTITAGVGIEVTDIEGGSKQISVKKGSATELGAYRVGSGLEVDEAGVLQVKRWQPIDTTAAFEFFDKNIQPIGDTLELNFNYGAAARDSAIVYYRMQADSLAQLGRPNTVTVTDWVPDKQWTYDSTPGFKLSTSELIGNATGRIEVYQTTPNGSSYINSPIRNGHGNIVLMWNNKQNTVTLPFVIKGRDFILDQVHPININGTPIGEGDTYSITSFGNLNVSYNLIDGTVVYNTNVFWNDGPVGIAYIEGHNFGADVSNKCVWINENTGMLTTLNANAGAVAYKINKPYIGMDTPNIGPSTVVNFNINYDNLSQNPTIKLSQSTTKNFGSSIVGQIQWPGYTGSNFRVRVDNVNIAGLNDFNRDNITVRVGDQFNIIPNRDGEVNITATPADYIGATAQTKVVVTLDEAMKPHVKITTDSTQVADTQKDIANPATVDVGNLAKFSKSQGIITFWTSGYPSREYFGNTYGSFKIGQITNQSIDIYQQPQFNFDFSQYSVGDKLSIVFNGNTWRGAYEVIFGEVVE